LAKASARGLTWMNLIITMFDMTTICVRGNFLRSSARLENTSCIY
jgi:hypothetical protein